MTVHDLRRIVMGRPRRIRPAGEQPHLNPPAGEPTADAGGGRFTRQDLMKDLDPGWLTWSHRLESEWEQHRRVT